jgi:hypothetical protein
MMANDVYIYQLTRTGARLSSWLILVLDAQGTQPMDLLGTINNAVKSQR